jgi:hypothetical protein
MVMVMVAENPCAITTEGNGCENRFGVYKRARNVAPSD